MRDDLIVVGNDAIADWIETTVLARAQSSWPRAAVERTAQEEIGVGLAQSNSAMLVMARRAEFLGDNYPFEISDLAIRRRSGYTTRPYTALLLLTSGSPCRQLVHRDSTPTMEAGFERIVAVAARNLWGNDGRSLRFGWPSDEGRPPEFDRAIPWLASRMGIEIGTGYRPPRRKDGGVDVVAWRPFPDGKSGFPILLVQCTIQADILTKASDIDLRIWSSWLVLDVDPVAALAVPQVVAPGTSWKEVTLQSMLLDRVRIASLTGISELDKEFSAWVEGAIDALSTRLLGAEV